MIGDHHVKFSVVNLIKQFQFPHKYIKFQNDIKYSRKSEKVKEKVGVLVIETQREVENNEHGREKVLVAICPILQNLFGYA